MKRVFVFLIAAVFLLSACAGQGVANVPVVTPTTPAQPEPTEGHIPVDISPAQRAAMEALASSLGISGDQIKLVNIEAVDWPNGCLGVQRIGVMCTQGIVPGFRVILEANGQKYEYHTSADGSRLVPASDGPLAAPDAPQSAAIDALASALGIEASGIKLMSSAQVEWPDSCLGIAEPDIACAQIVIPGYLIVLEANGVQYEYHTNQDGSIVKPATLALTWHREGGIAGFCDDLSVFLPGDVHASGCKADASVSNGSLTALLSKDQLAQLDGWLSDYGTVTITMKDPAVADAMTQTLTLYGQGSGQPGEADKQAMLDWAQNLFNLLKP